MENLLLSGELRSVAEEEERRLLMAASAGCLRLVVEDERLSIGQHRQTDQGSKIRGIKTIWDLTSV